MGETERSRGRGQGNRREDVRKLRLSSLPHGCLPVFTRDLRREGERERGKDRERESRS